MASVIYIAGLTPRAFAGWLGTDFVLAVERSKRMLKAQHLSCRPLGGTGPLWSRVEPQEQLSRDF
jgi:hypothetical protein